MRYSLRQLEVFLATARHENISRAARDLAMSQSAASGSLKELEGQFAVKLFDRVGKRLQLNELGRQLRPQAETLLAQARGFEQALAGETGMGRLHIGATMTIGNYLAVGMIADFRSRYPDADVALTVANTETIAEGVAGFELDMGMIEGEFQHPELETLHWRDDELVVFAAPGHPAAAGWRAGRSRPAIPALDRAGARLGHPPDLRPGDARTPAGPRTSPWNCSIRKRSSEPWRPGWVWAACPASVWLTPSGGALWWSCTPASGTSAVSCS